MAEDYANVHGKSMWYRRVPQMAGLVQRKPLFFEDRMGIT
jgi:hypothetical protein